MDNLPAAAGGHQPCTIHEYYALNGYLVMASDSLCALGPLDRNDWNEDEMCEFRWSIVGHACVDDLLAQNSACGFRNPIDRRFRWFYRVVALD